MLGRTAFGELAIIQSTLYMLAGVGSAGLGVTSTRYLAQLKDSDPERAGKILGISSSVSAAASIFFGLILLVFSPLLAARSFNAPELSGVLRLSSVAVLFVSMNAFQTGSLMGLHAFRVSASLNLLQGVISLLTILALVPLYGLTGAVWSLILTAGIVWMLSQKKLLSECRLHGIRIRYKGIWEERRIFYDFALPAALSGIAGQLAAWGSNALIARQSNGLAELGLFSVANTFRQLVLFAPGVLTKVATPLLAHLTTDAGSRRYRSSFSLNVRITALLAFGAAAALAVLAPLLLRIYGKSYDSAYRIIVILVFTGALEAMSSAYFQALIGHGKIWWQLTFATVWSVFLVLGTLLLGPHLGAMGLSIAYLTGAIFYVASYRAAAGILHRGNNLTQQSIVAVAEF
jgi:O-antigen/teichoic acid export membrane protein